MGCSRRGGFVEIRDFCLFTVSKNYPTVTSACKPLRHHEKTHTHFGQEKKRTKDAYLQARGRALGSLRELDGSIRHVTSGFANWCSSFASAVCTVRRWRRRRRRANSGGARVSSCIVGVPPGAWEMDLPFVYLLFGFEFEQCGLGLVKARFDYRWDRLILNVDNYSEYACWLL